MMTNDLIKDQQFAASFAEIHPPLGRREALVEANRCLYCCLLYTSRCV